jgi:hypothetical protein
MSPYRPSIIRREVDQAKEDKDVNQRFLSSEDNMCVNKCKIKILQIIEFLLQIRDEYQIKKFLEKYQEFTED